MTYPTEREFEDLSGMARQIMSCAEWEGFLSLPPKAAHEAFFDLWTRKEALLKAAGTGFLTDPRAINLGIATAAATTSIAGRTFTVSSVGLALRTKAAVAVEGALRGIRMFDANEQTETFRPT